MKGDYACERAFHKALIDKFPPLDMTWPDELRAAWFDLFWRLCALVLSQPCKRADDGEMG